MRKISHLIGKLSATLFVMTLIFNDKHSHLKNIISINKNNLKQDSGFVFLDGVSEDKLDLFCSFSSSCQRQYTKTQKFIGPLCLFWLQIRAHMGVLW